MCVQGVPSGFSEASRRTQLLQKKYVHGLLGCFCSIRPELPGESMKIGCISCKPSDDTKRLSLLVENIRCIFCIVCIGFTSHINNLKKKRIAFELRLVFASFCQN